MVPKFTKKPDPERVKIRYIGCQANGAKLTAAYLKIRYVGAHCSTAAYLKIRYVGTHRSTAAYLKIRYVGAHCSTAAYLKIRYVGCQANGAELTAALQHTLR